MNLRTCWVAVVAVAFLWLVAPAAEASPLLSDASLICAQTPTDTAADAANSQITPDDPLPGNANCPKLCKKWVAMCKGVVAKSKSCWLAAGAKVAGVRNLACNQFTDDATKQSCKATVKSEREALKTFLDMNVESGKGFCEGTGVANCLLNCS